MSGLKFVGQALLALPAWLLYFALMIPLMVFGAILVPLATLWGAGYDKNKRLQFDLPMPRIYNNREDGIDGCPLIDPPKNPAWDESTKTWGFFRRIFVWSAWRNSVGNARWKPFLGMTVDPDKVWIYIRGGLRTTPAAFAPPSEYLKEGPYLARQGWRHELKFCWNPKQPDWTKRRYCWIGWRIAQQGSVTTGVGFAFQLRMSL